VSGGYLVPRVVEVRPPVISIAAMNDSLDAENNSCNRSVQLQLLMRSVGIKSYKALARSAGTSILTINKIRSGKLGMLSWQTIVNTSNILQISPIEFIELFGDGSLRSDRQELTALQKEYARLQQQLQQQRETLQAEFQFQSLQVLESYLTYFPTAKHAATKNPDFPATKIFPLVGAIDRLMAQWGVSTIGSVGAEIPYDPQYHQLIEGTANLDELVMVRYVGYLQGNKLLFRAKVQRQQ
jgi:transcriptional regulator with XRE-family HTH domain